MKNFLSTTPYFQEQALFVVRVITGLFMVYHGWEVFSATDMNSYLEWDMFKNSSGKTMIYLGKGLEFAIGILLTAGFLTRIASLLLIAVMLYIAFVVGKGIIWYGDQHSFMFVLIGIIYLAFGGGKWSLDRRFFG